MKSFDMLIDEYKLAHPDCKKNDATFYAKQEMKKQNKTRVEVAKEYIKRDKLKSEERVGKAYLFSANSKNLTMKLSEDVEFDPERFIEEVGDACLHNSIMINSTKDLIANCGMSAYKILKKHEDKLMNINLEINTVRTPEFVLIEKVK